MPELWWGFVAETEPADASVGAGAGLDDAGGEAGRV